MVTDDGKVSRNILNLNPFTSSKIRIRNSHKEAYKIKSTSGLCLYLNPKISIAIDAATSDEKTVYPSAVVLTKFLTQYQSKITQAFYMITRGFIFQEDSHSPLLFTSDSKFQPLEREKSAREAKPKKKKRYGLEFKNLQTPSGC